MQRHPAAGMRSSRSTPGPSSSQDTFSMPLRAGSSSRLATKQGSTSDVGLYPFPGTPNEHRTHSSTRNVYYSQGGGPSVVHAPAPRPARISKLLNAVLNTSATQDALGPRSAGAPFSAGHRNDGMPFNAPVRPRAPSPTPTADYSFVSPPSPMSFVHVLPSDVNSDFNEYLVSGPEGTPNCNLFVSPTGSARRSPRLRNKAAQGCQWLLGALSYPSRRGRTKCRGVFDLFDEDGWPLPLDGEEGELIDEACFVAVQTERVKGMGESHFASLR